MVRSRGLGRGTGPNTGMETQHDQGHGHDHGHGHGQWQRRRLRTHVRWHGEGHGHGHERAGQYNDNGAVQGGVYTLYIASNISEQYAVPGVPSWHAVIIPLIHDIVILLSKNRGPCVVHMFSYLAKIGARFVLSFPT